MEGMDFLDHEDLVDFGYTWKGMVGIRSLANAFTKEITVYVLYDDDTESLVDEEYKLFRECFIWNRKGRFSKIYFFMVGSIMKGR